MKKIIATFHCFKESGKWYTTADGFLPSWFLTAPWDLKMSHILQMNNGTWPGLSTDAGSFYCVVFPDGGVPFLLLPKTAKAENEGMVEL